MSSARLVTGRASACVGVLSLALAACDADADSSASSVVVRDSAGITIVENGPLRSNGPAFQIEGPLLEIGTVDGDPEYQLFQVADATRLPDGRIVVANRGSHELRWYDASGTFVRSVGGEGEGPGEFRRLLYVSQFADSLLAHDNDLRRSSIFTANGEFVRDFGLRSERPSSPTGALSDGSQLAIGYAPSEMPAPAADGLLRIELFTTLFDPEGSETPIPPTGELEMAAITTDRGEIISQFTGARDFKSTALRDHLLMGHTDSFEFRVYDRAGRLLSIVRLDQPQVGVTSGDHDRMVAERLANAATPFARQMNEGMPRVETMPSFVEMTADDAGRVWLQDGLHPEAEGQVWTAFDPDGRALGKLSVPAGLAPLEFGSDYLIALATDELGIERVQLWTLVAPEAESGA